MDRKTYGNKRKTDSLVPLSLGGSFFLALVFLFGQKNGLVFSIVFSFFGGLAILLCAYHLFFSSKFNVSLTDDEVEIHSPGRTKTIAIADIAELVKLEDDITITTKAGVHHEIGAFWFGGHGEMVQFISDLKLKQAMRNSSLEEWNSKGASIWRR